MSKFFITAKDLSGKVLNETVEAVDSRTAVQHVQGKGFFVTSVKEVDENAPEAPKTAKSSASGPKVDRKFARNKVDPKDIFSFSRQLATMLEAGVPLMRCLIVITEQVESKELHRVLTDIINDVEQGQPFSQALIKHPRVFTPFWSSLVEVGEASGTMPKVLEKLTLYMEEAAAFRSTIIGALIYPAVMFTICMLAVIVFAVVIGPTFEKIFKDLGANLPVLTVAVMGLFKIIQTQFLFLVGAGVAAFFVFKGYIATPLGKRSFEAFLFGLPGFGNIFKLVVVEKFTSQMAILIDSGVPILFALEISERLVENSICAEVIKKVGAGVREGRLIADLLDENAFFPVMAVQMIRVGEETGELGQMMNHVAVFYKKQTQEAMKGFGTLIEPVMLVVMGGIIGTLVVAMFLPILSLSTGG